MRKPEPALPSKDYTLVQVGGEYTPHFKGASIREGYSVKAVRRATAIDDCILHANNRDRAIENLAGVDGNYRLLHDTDLERLLDLPGASVVFEGRTRAAAQIRLALARVYARGDMATHSQWHVVPGLTEKGTIGILNIADGTAWDTHVEADPGVHDLGLEGAVYGAANGFAGTVAFDGVVVQQDGVAAGTTLKMPVGWQQIALPTWRGYKGTSPYRSVPAEEYKPEAWIKPTLVAAGLMTCYGRPGKLRATLADTAGWHIDRDPTSMEPAPNKWPNGVPAWITKDFERCIQAEAV